MKRSSTPRSHDFFSRRALLRTLGASAGLVPLVGLDRALGQTRDGVPARLLIVAQSNGIVHDTFWPLGSNARDTSLSSLTFPAITQPLARHRDDLIFVAGLEYANFRRFYPAGVNYNDSHHAFPHALTGSIGVMGMNSTTRPQDGASGDHPTAGSLSIDQFIANEIGRTTPLPFPMVTAGIKSASGERTMSQLSFRGADQPNQAESDPWNLFARLFANIDPSDTAALRLRREKESILDYVGTSIERWSRRLGREDRDKVGQHLAAIRRLEQSLQASGNTTAACTRPELGTKVAVNEDANIPRMLSAQFDNLVAAMACDLTRSATLMVGHGGGDYMLSWLGPEFTSGGALAGNVGLSRSHHDMAHAERNNAEAKRLKSIAETWYMEQFAALIDRLKAIPEDGGTMLDHTVVLWINNMGTGYDHRHQGVPWVLAGGRKLGLRTGRLLQLGEWAARGQNGTLAPQNGVLVGLANAILGTNLTTFGDAQFGGELDGLRG